MTPRRWHGKPTGRPLQSLRPCWAFMLCRQRAHHPSQSLHIPRRRDLWTHATSREQRVAQDLQPHRRRGRPARRRPRDPSHIRPVMPQYVQCYTAKPCHRGGCLWHTLRGGCCHGRHQDSGRAQGLQSPQAPRRRPALPQRYGTTLCGVADASPGLRTSSCKDPARLHSKKIFHTMLPQKKIIRTDDVFFF